MKPSAWQIALRLLPPLAAAVALITVVTPKTDLDHDLLLVAPERAQAGASIPLRALAYAGVNAPEGPKLVLAKVEVELQRADDPQRRALASTKLNAGHGPSLEGALRIPEASRQGEALRLVARATFEGESESLSVERKLVIATAPRVEPAARPLRGAQQLVLGPIETLGAQPPPDRFEVRVVGGVCVPETSCEVLLRIGEPSAALKLEPAPSFTQESMEPLGETPGVVDVRLRTHGPDAKLELIATRSSVPVAKRTVQLPVALGADAIEVSPRVLAPGEQLAVALLGDDAADAIVDVFADGAWIATRSITSTRERPAALELPPRALGTLRLQVRRDPFASDSAAVRSVFVLRTRAWRSEQDFVQGTVDRVFAEDDERARWALAEHDVGLFALPQASSAYPAARARAEVRRGEVRKLALLTIALAAMSLVLMLVQRGLRGSAQATDVMRASGIDLEGVERARLRMLVRLLGVVLSVLLAFVAIALYLIARG